jgi:hypothetical protein
MPMMDSWYSSNFTDNGSWWFASRQTESNISSIPSTACTFEIEHPARKEKWMRRKIATGASRETGIEPGHEHFYNQSTLGYQELNSKFMVKHAHLIQRTMQPILILSVFPGSCSPRSKKNHLFQNNRMGFTEKSTAGNWASNATIYEGFASEC